MLFSIKVHQRGAFSIVVQDGELNIAECHWPNLMGNKRSITIAVPKWIGELISDDKCPCHLVIGAMKLVIFCSPKENIWTFLSMLLVVR